MGRLKEFLLGTRIQQADNDKHLKLLLEAHYLQYLEERKKWTKEEKNAQNATIAEWIQLNKPNKKNTNLKNN